MIGAAFHDRRVRWLAVALVLIKLWFVTAQPVVVVAGAGLDDRLFVSMADRIVSGHWLGDYDQFTLAKGPGYPLFIALAFWLGLPLPLAEHGLYVLACWLVVRALRPVLRNDGWALLLFAALVWQPMSYAMPEPWGGSVVRQNLYTPLTLLIFAGIIGLHTRGSERPAVRLAWASLLGVSAAWFWITREEGVWILPSVAVLVGAGLVLRGASVHAYAVPRDPAATASAGQSDDEPRRQRSRRISIAGIIWPWLLGAGVMGAGVATICAINYRHYGWFGECEFHAPQFRGAYGALTRIKVGNVKLRVPVTQAMRLAGYEVSPTFAELRSIIEGKMSERWAGRGPEFNGGMWMWALRDAVVESGHGPNPAAALAYYQQIADEVNAACEAGRVPAYARRSSFLPVWTSEYTAEAKQDLWPFARGFVLWERFRARPPPSQSHGIASLMLIFHDMTQWPLSPSADEPARDTPRTKALRGWKIGALQSIGEFVRWPIIGATALGLAFWFWSAGCSVFRRRLPHYLWWVATSALGGACAVWIISFLVHVTSWPDMRPLRFAQAYPLLVLFAGAAIVDAFETWRPRRPRADENEWKGMDSPSPE